MTSKTLLLTSVIALAVTTQAQADSAQLVDKQDKSRLSVTVDSLADRGRFRIVDINARLGQQRWDLNRQQGKTWVGRWSVRAKSLKGKEITLRIFRRNAPSLVRKIKLADEQNNNQPDQPKNPDKPKEPTPAGVNAEGLYPQWSPNLSDLTVLCPDSKVKFTVNDQRSISIDGQEAKQGEWEQTVTLSPGQATTVVVDGSSQNIRCRPAEMPLPRPEVTGETEADSYLIAPTLNFLGSDKSGQYVMALNNQGVPIWWFKDNSGGPLDLKLIDQDTLAWTRGVGPFSVAGNHYDLRGLDGSLQGTVAPVGYGADHHDLQPTSDGGWLMIIYAPRDCPNTPSDCEDLSPWGGPSQANVIDGIIQKVDSSGNLVWQWNSRDHIAVSETAPWLPSIGPSTLPGGGQAYDIIHLNSVEEDGTGIIFSARHLNAVYRIGDPGGSGAVDWKIGGTTRAESLTTVDDPLGSNPLGGQHDARVLDDGSVTIHENGSLLSRPPRMVRYQINGSQATLVESISDPDITGSICCGGGRRMAGGSWAVSWGAGTRVAEYNSSGERVFSVALPLSSYRVVPVTNSQISQADLRAGMNSQYPR